MATQRIVSKEKSYLDNDGKAPTEKSNIAPAVPSSVIAKLLSFTFAMITLPLGTYFFMVNVVIVGNTTYAGALAAIMANIVLFAYVIVAMKEDQSERLEEEEKKKKSL
ncbi:vacuolar ATPase assembly integral membrane protein VMA21 [Aaosphaeria arxii CBS 175.79]|uniref:Vacuolar ATPase assembly integral membrane protein VMA21 n=1 Tax=Aaosphaeria arxii CBS 175.79 TaxID=1450172 RepID=A0A6A5XAN6_9PLEO|nr:vacuolar ATPase assembly integral membrane protein VMA21 [Aaosphaeria arxii CBS 175.79]KAF2009834.1 vacuolar ATPase assembly integral membrane protein VMA21 [Aaosphaeria arxii CBS 175.79]